MAGAIVYDKDAALRQGIYQAGTSLGQALQYRGKQSNEEEKRQTLLKENQANQQKYGGVLAQTLSDLPENPSPIQLTNAIGSMLNEGVPMEYVKGIMPMFSAQMKSGVEGQQRRGFLEDLGIFPPQGPGQNQQQPVQNQQQQGQPTNAIPGTQPMEQGQQPQGMPAQPQQQPQQPQPQPQQQPPPTTSGNALENLSDNQLLGMIGSGIPQAKALADGEVKRREMSQKNFRSDRDFAYKKSGKFFDKLEDEADRLGDQSEALDNMENAIKTGNTSFWSADNLSNFMGKFGEVFRTAKGAQLITAQKEFLLADLGRLGGRPNQWIEQQVSSALTKLGRSDEANLTVVSALRARIERSQAKQDVSRNLENEYLEKDGTIPANFTNIVRETMKPIEKQIQGKLSYNLRDLYEKENSGKLKEIMNKKVPTGTPLTSQMAKMFSDKYGGDAKRARENVLKLGYDIPTDDEYRRYIK